MNGKQKAALMQTSFTMFQEGRLNEAAAILEGLIVLDRENAYAHGLLGAVHQQKSENDSAIACYGNAIKSNPRDIQSLVNRGEIYLTQRNMIAAMNDFLEAIRLDPDKKHPAANRARLFVSLTQEAIKVAKDQRRASWVSQ
jgi:tetratricopeptide (TPR) repeat protein